MSKEQLILAVQGIQETFNNKVDEFSTYARNIDSNTAQMIEFSKKKSEKMNDDYVLIEQRMQSLYQALNIKPQSGEAGQQDQEKDRLLASLFKLDQRMGIFYLTKYRLD